jgi:hypothetical protein
MVWELLGRSTAYSDVVESAADEIVMSHDNDFELLWNTLNRTDMMVLAGMSDRHLPMSAEFNKLFGTGASSTVFSTLQRLME